MKGLCLSSEQFTHCTLRVLNRYSLRAASHQLLTAFGLYCENNNDNNYDNEYNNE